MGALLAAGLTATALAVTGPGAAQAAPNGSGCNKTDAKNISACFVNHSGGGYSLTVYNRRNIVITAGNVGRVQPGKSKTYSQSDGSFNYDVGIFIFRQTSPKNIATLRRRNFTAATP